MIRLLAALLLMASPVTAESVRIRSGEHDGFSRLVLEIGSPVDWTLRRVGNVYNLRIDRPGIHFDTSRVFSLIPRMRITALEMPDESVLSVRVAGTVHADAFTLEGGAIVLDIRSGPAPADSVFERPPDPEFANAISAGAALPGFRARSRVDPSLPVYWRDSAVDPVENSSERRVEVIPPAIALEFPDPRLAEAETELLQQLGRAAAQGLITIDAAPRQPRRDAVLGGTDDAASPASQALASAQDHLAITSQTVVDRDSPNVDRVGLGDNGHDCLPNEIFDLSAWLDGSPPGDQIAALRRQLVGEFDRPSPETVVLLVRLYIALGFGAESVALMDAMGPLPTGTDELRYIAAVIDGRGVDPGSAILTMTGCNTSAALWAVLGGDGLGKPETANFGAIQRSFSALPLALRQHLGPLLVERMIGLGVPDVAHTIREAIARAPGEHGGSINMIDARIDLARGRAADVKQGLAPIISGNGEQALEAMLLSIDARLALGEAVEQVMIDNIAAMAFEHRNSIHGPAAARAHVLAAGSAGRFGEAFTALGAWPEVGSGDLSDHTTRDLFRQLVALRDDATFLEVFFARQRAADVRRLDWTLRADLAQRLLNLGFSVEARRVAGPGAATFDRGRVLLARAALLDRDGPAALAHIGELSGDAADTIRGEAFRLLGDHKSAQASFISAGEMESAVSEAWRGGDWEMVAQAGSEPKRSVVERFAPARLQGAPEAAGNPAVGLPGGAQLAAPATQDDGPLSRNRAVLAQSQSMRSALMLLLKETEGS